MNLHANAALSLNARRRLVARIVDEGWSLTSAARAAEVSDRTARKWVARWRAESRRGQANRGPDGRRTAGWEFVHVCIDDATRLAYVEVLKDEKATTCIAFMRRAIAFYTARGITVERVMTDNGPGYLSTLHALTCRTLGIKHLRTRPYRPRTNGKAERFIRTMLGGWAYGAIYRSSTERTSALAGWIDFYNHRRPHGSLSHQPPISRLHQLTGNNLAGSYS